MAREPSGEWWAGVIHQFQAHVREESSFLATYEEAVARSTDDAFRFLLRVILDDERRHHELFDEMSRAALGEGETVPAPPAPDPETARTLLEPTERFLAAERDDQAKLRALRKDLAPAARDTLWPLLVELMEIDTQKHVRILEYLRDRLRAGTKA